MFQYPNSLMGFGAAAGTATLLAVLSDDRMLLVAGLGTTGTTDTGAGAGAGAESLKMENLPTEVEAVPPVRGSGAEARDLGAGNVSLFELESCQSRRSLTHTPIHT